MTRVVLASASPRRQELLAALVPAFEVDPSDIPEPLTGDPVADARSLARAKALAVGERRRGNVVIGSDTIVHIGSRTYGKPADPADAVRILRELRGRTHEVTTGVAVVDGAGRVAVAVSTSRVELTALTDAGIDAYVASGRPLDKAGAYAIQDTDVPTVASHVGCYCGVMGLPLWQTKRLLEAAGVPCSDPAGTYKRCLACPEH